MNVRPVEPSDEPPYPEYPSVHEFIAVVRFVWHLFDNINWVCVLSANTIITRCRGIHMWTSNTSQWIVAKSRHLLSPCVCVFFFALIKSSYINAAMRDEHWAMPFSIQYTTFRIYPPITGRANEAIFVFQLPLNDYTNIGCRAWPLSVCNVRIDTRSSFMQKTLDWMSTDDGTRAVRVSQQHIRSSKWPSEVPFE